VKRDEELRILLRQQESPIRGSLTEVGFEVLIHQITTSDWLANVKADELEDAADQLNRYSSKWGKNAAMWLYGRAHAIRDKIKL
jgi:GH24 family phage-related lysozyme (muramidase)